VAVGGDRLVEQDVGDGERVADRVVEERHRCGQARGDGRAVDDERRVRDTAVGGDELGIAALGRGVVAEADRVRPDGRVVVAGGERRDRARIDAARQQDRDRTALREPLAHRLFEDRREVGRRPALRRLPPALGPRRRAELEGRARRQLLHALEQRSLARHVRERQERAHGVQIGAGAEAR